VDPYTYLNAVLDSNPTITRLALNSGPSSVGASTYWIALYGAPQGEPQVVDRVAVEDGGAEEPNRGYDVDGALVASFWC